MEPGSSSSSKSGTTNLIAAITSALVVDPARGYVVGRVRESVGRLQQRRRPAEVVDIAEVEAVVGLEPPGYAGEVDRRARRRGVDELRCGKGEVREVPERSPRPADAQVDDLQVGGAGQVMAQQLADLLEGRDDVRGGQRHRQILAQGAGVGQTGVDADRAGQADALDPPTPRRLG